MLYWDLILEVKEEEVKETFERLYTEMSLAQMAKHYGVSATALRGAFKRYGVKMRPRGGHHPYRRKNAHT